MRVLVVDQDSASNEAIARSLRELFTVDAVTNKGDCLDLLRSNTFEVIVATERLEDGSGLELLGQVAKKWPSMLRIFAADRHRLQLLKGRLGPFELFQALTYPIDPDRLIASLNLAEAAQQAHADTSNIQHVVLSGDVPQEVVDEFEQSDEGQDIEESEDFPAPQPAPRVAPIEQAASRGGHAAAVSRGAPAHRGRAAPVQRPRTNGAAGRPTARPGNSPSLARTGGGPSLARTGAGPSLARSAAASAPSPSEGARPSRHGRSRSGTYKAPPVRFPPIERSPPLEPPSESGRAGGSRSDSFAEAAAMARAARSNFEAPVEEFDSQRLMFMIGGGVVATLALVALGFKLFGSKSETPHPAPPPVVQAPQYPQEVTDLIAQTEAALKNDDFKTARVNVDKLRQLAPSHPRLGFFDGLLAQHADNAKANAPLKAQSGRVASRKGSGPTSTAAATPGAATSGAATSGAATSAVAASAGMPSAAASGSAPSAGASVAAPTAGSAAPESTAQVPPGFAPPTPPGFSRSSSEASETAPHVDAATATTSAAPPTPVVAPASTAQEPVAPASTASLPPHPAPAAAAPPRRAPSGEPPPVIREAKLIRRVVPDYPSAAKRDGIVGSVDLEVTVSARGVVDNVVVVRANPPEMFDKAAISAVRKWKYDPRYVDGLPSEAHLNVHLEFGPDK